MTGRLLHAWYILPLASLALYGYTRVNVIHVGNNYLETFIWTFRSWRLNQPVSQDLLEWAHPEDDDDDDEYMRRALRAMGAWKFLSPFFASRGYTLYTRGIATILTPPPTPPPAVAQDYPFARLLGTPVDYDWEANRVWPARDRLGRDVVIKLIANSKQSPELEALQRLNSPSARLDSRNNTIPILEYLHWGTLVFAVMPRWFSAFNVDFEHLGEAVHLWEQLLEGLEFCHEHRVAHCDILEQNIVLDVLIPERTIGTLKNVTGSESRFAFIDFGLATVIPYTMALEDAPLRTDIIFERRAGLGSRRPCNPFVVDVMSIGSLMQRLIRLASDVFPEGDHLLDKMMGLTSESIPTATEALVELRAIKARLSEDTLQFYLPGMIWRKQGDGYYIVPRP